MEDISQEQQEFSDLEDMETKKILDTIETMSENLESVDENMARVVKKVSGLGQRMANVEQSMSNVDQVSNLDKNGWVTSLQKEYKRFNEKVGKIGKYGWEG